MLKGILIVLMTAILTGCRNDNVVDDTLPTWTYFAIEDSPGADGWQHLISITVHSGDIVVLAELDSLLPATTSPHSRREMAQFDEYDAIFGYNFYEEVEFFERRLVGNHLSEVENLVRGAVDANHVSFETERFADLIAIALATPPIVSGDLIDGFYRSFSADSGYRYFVQLYVHHGRIVSVHFNAIDADGDLRYEYVNFDTVDVDALDWPAQANIFARSLIASQNPAYFTFDANGYTDEIPHVNIPIEPLVSLVTNALAAGPVVTNSGE